MLRSHGVGGFTGCVLTGLFADTRVNTGGVNGAFHGNPNQLKLQFLSALLATICVFIVSYILCRIVAFFIPLRVSVDQEKLGLDYSAHGHRTDSTKRFLNGSDTTPPGTPDVEAGSNNNTNNNKAPFPTSTSEDGAVLTSPPTVSVELTKRHPHPYSPTMGK